jgi:hypothetical protein
MVAEKLPVPGFWLFLPPLFQSRQKNHVLVHKGNSKKNKLRAQMLADAWHHRSDAFRFRPAEALPVSSAQDWGSRS